jgi:tetratricopeptide (TPR) repeat protein
MAVNGAVHTLVGESAAHHTEHYPGVLMRFAAEVPSPVQCGAWSPRRASPRVLRRQTLAYTWSPLKWCKRRIRRRSNGQGGRVGARSDRNSAHPEYRTILAVDIERYGRLDRTDLVRVALRRRLADWSAVLLARAGAAHDQWVRQDTGDGWIVSVDPHLPRDLLLTTAVAGLRRRLVAFNRGKAEAERLRVRLVMHAGEVLRDPDPLVGEATNHACRLLDSEVLRACLQVTTQPLAVIVSTGLYEGVVKHGYGGLDPAVWHPVVADLKEGSAPAWVHVPGDADAPVRAGVVTTSNDSRLGEHRLSRSLLEWLPGNGRDGPLVSNLPARNPNFTGRADLLDRMHDQLHPGHLAAVVQAQAQALHGLGGVGKTQLALEYAHCHVGDYDLIWWVTAEQPAAIPGQLVALARRLGLPEQPEQAETVHVLWDALRGRGRWLLIFDNAEDPSDLSPWWPPDSGRVLVTSRAPTWAGAAATVRLDVMDRSEAVAFLQRRVGTNDPAFEQLAEALGDLPLALEQAAAYLEETGTPVGDYVELLRERSSELFALGRPANTEQTVATTWTLALERIGDQSPIGRDLLYLCAFLAPDDLPRSLLTEYPEVLPERLAAAVRDRIAFQQAVGALRRYSLVTTTGDTLQVHRLVGAVTRHALTTDEQQQWAMVALGLVLAGYPEEADNVDKWPIATRLLPHALAATAHPMVEDAAPEWVVHLLNRIGDYLWERAEFDQAERVLDQSRTTAEARLGADHPDTATSLDNLAAVLRARGDLDRARALHERALTIRETRLGANHPDTATSLNNLALVLRAQSDLDCARALYERALAFYEARIGPDHPETAWSLTGLALVLHDQSDLDHARALYQRALTIRETRLGPDHPHTATSLNNLATVLYDQGDLDHARPLFERGLAIREARLGPDHPATAWSLTGLALVLHAQGDLQGARSLHERALAIRETRLGADHHYTAQSLNNLAGVLQDQGDLQGARSLHERALTVRETRLGADHPDTLRSRASLGAVVAALENGR